MVDVEKRKIPAFHRCMPPLSRASAASACGFSTNEDKGCATGAKLSDSFEESPNQPYPVSARSGRMPKVTIWPSLAVGIAASTVALNRLASVITWSDGETNMRLLPFWASSATAAAQTAAAVSRAKGSIKIICGSISIAASCSTTIKRKSEPVTTDGAPKLAPNIRRAEAWKRLSSPKSLTNCLGCDLRESGHRRVPEPPQSKTGYIRLVIN